MVIACVVLVCQLSVIYAEAPIYSKPMSAVSAHPQILVLNDRNPCVKGIAICPDRPVFGTCGNDRTTRLWEARIGDDTQVAVFTEPKQRARCIAFSTDGEFLAVGGWHNYPEPLMIDGTGDPLVRTEGCVYIRKWAEDFISCGLVICGQATSIAFGKDDKSLVIGTDLGTVEVWERIEPLVHPRAFHRIGTLIHCSQKANISVTFFPNGKAVATSGGGFVKLWRIGEYAAFSMFAGHGPVAVSADGKFIAFHAKANPPAVELIELDSGLPPERLVPDKQALDLIDAQAYLGLGALLFSRDRTILLQGHHRAVSLWDLVGKKEFAYLDVAAAIKGRELIGDVNHVALTSDETVLLTAHEFATDVQLWDMRELLNAR